MTSFLANNGMQCFCRSTGRTLVILGAVVQSSFICSAELLCVVVQYIMLWKVFQL